MDMARGRDEDRVSVMNEGMESGGSGDGSGSELRGTIKWFNPEKGYGFVSPADGSQDVFLHISALKQVGLQDAPEGSTIHCEVGQGRKGVQVLRVIALDASTAAPRPPQRPRRHGPPRGPQFD
jgi:CspA family cold shock protein